MALKKKTTSGVNPEWRVDYFDGNDDFIDSDSGYSSVEDADEQATAYLNGAAAGSYVLVSVTVKRFTNEVVSVSI